nr:EOG090X0B4J [Moina brachiata]
MALYRSRFSSRRDCILLIKAPIGYSLWRLLAEGSLRYCRNQPTCRNHDADQAHETGTRGIGGCPGVEDAADALADDDRADNGPEDLFLEELVRNIKWATANRDRQRYQHREQRPAVDDVFELLHDADALDQDGDDEERLAFNNEFNAEPSRNIEQSSSPHKSFALRPGDPGFYSDRQQPAVAELDPVIAPEPVALPAAPAVASRDEVTGQKEDVFGEPSEPRQPADKFRSIVTSSTPSSREHDAPDAVEARPARDPVAHAMVSDPKAERPHDSLADLYLTALVAGCTASATAALLGLGVCFYRYCHRFFLIVKKRRMMRDEISRSRQWQRRAKAAQEVEYPAYGVTGPGPCQSGKSSLKSSPTSSTPGTVGGWSLTKSPKGAAQTGDKKLAHSAHMFHFQHQKQQVIALENSNAGCDRAGSNSGGESDEDNEEGDYTVYECPGLAPTGEMEVKNPLFLDDPTPASPALKQRQSE